MGSCLFKKTLGTEEEHIIKKLEKQALEKGNKPYIYYGEEDVTYTYNEINAMANHFAYKLLDLGVEKGNPVSVFLKNPVISTIVMYGIWKAGAVFSPINFNYIDRLLSYQIDDTNPKLLITERQMVPILNNAKGIQKKLPVMIYNPKDGDHDYYKEVEKVHLDERFQEIPLNDFYQKVEENPVVETNFYDVASIIYTSGTTGPAKGVIQSYRWIHGYTYFLRMMNNEEDVIYNDLPMYHVGGAFENVARAALIGCTVALWDKFSPHDFWKRIKKSGATNAILLDVMIPWLMKAPSSENDRKNTLKSVYMQPLPQYYRDFSLRFGVDFVFPGYGQTEAGNGFGAVIDVFGEEGGTPLDLYKGLSREQIIQKAEQLNLRVIKGDVKLSKGYMGSPPPFVETIILNDYGEECAIGEVGEIALRPKYPSILLKEYYNQPKATTESFKDLWFHTGDVGYQDEKGQYYFVDRMKDVIRRKGENISSYQIEDIINQHKQISMSAAFPIPAQEGDENEIVVYAVVKWGSLAENELLEWTKEFMPKFMWPNHIRIVSDLPRTPTNKIEKYKLKNEILKELGMPV